MTVDEVRAQCKMVDVLSRYGMYPNRSGFIRCPFHQGDHTASLKVYKDSFYCFGCHAHGDIFSFVMLMDNCGFRDAFKTLGGTNERMSDAAILRITKRKREAERHRKRLTDAMRRTRYASAEYQSCKTILDVMVPFSDAWCEMQNMLPVLERNADKALETYLDVISEGR